MTQITQQAPKSPLSPNSMKAVLAAQTIIYDPKAIDLLNQQLANTKSEKAITPTVALAATTILHKMGDKVDQLPEEEMWGKHGVVHGVLDSLYEVAKGLGYKAPRSDLKQAYEMVETQLESAKQQPQDQQQVAPQGAPPMQGVMPQQSSPPQGVPAPMTGSMPQ